MAQKNAAKLGAKVEFLKSDLMKNIDDNFDIVVANLPYVDEKWEWIDKEALAREPAMALYAEDGGLALIKELINQASECAIPYLVLEADPCQHERTIGFAKGHGYSLLEIRGFIMVFNYSF